MSARPTIVFFDAAGTLVRAAEPIGQTYAKLAWHYGVRADAELIHRGFKTAWKTFHDPASSAERPQRSSYEWWKALVRETWKIHPLPESFPFEDYFAELVEVFGRPELWRTFPEVERVLQRLRSEGIRCGVLSNWDARLRLVLSGQELAEYFDTVVISGEVGFEKPDPGMFLKAQEMAGVGAGEAMLIGDDPLMDGKGATDAGWKVELVHRPHRNLEMILDDLILTLTD
jgi:REG-2-like HAD superfamily hydrolase